MYERAVTDEDLRAVRDKVARLRAEGRELSYRDFTLEELEVLREGHRREAEAALADAEKAPPGGPFGEPPERLAAILARRYYLALTEDIARKREEMGLPSEPEE